jgi:hypothetical protein
LRDLNPNVFYELAVCHIARKPCILMIQKGQTIPFDTSHIRTIFYDIDLRSGKETEDRLDKILQKKLVEDIQNPILMGLDALTLKESNDPEKQSQKESLTYFKVWIIN